MKDFLKKDLKVNNEEPRRPDSAGKEFRNASPDQHSNDIPNVVKDFPDNMNEKIEANTNQQINIDLNEKKEGFIDPKGIFFRFSDFVAARQINKEMFLENLVIDIDEQELEKCFRKINFEISSQELKIIFEYLNGHISGIIKTEEFINQVPYWSTKDFNLKDIQEDLQSHLDKNRLFSASGKKKQFEENEEDIQKEEAKNFTEGLRPYTSKQGQYGFEERFNKFVSDKFI